MRLKSIIPDEKPSNQPPMQEQHREHHGPYAKIVVQPASKAVRFRYECEHRSTSIPGVSSTHRNKTFPTIKIYGYQGNAVVLASCVTKDPPYRPHPFKLVGREGCKRGVCSLEISPETMCAVFSNLGIQCIKRRNFASSLKLREEIGLDPFMTGFSHGNQSNSIDLNVIRLCFQVFLEGDRGKFTIPLAPVVSEPIYDKKTISDLIIVELSHCCSYVNGSKENIILLCEKVVKEDIQVRFFEEKDGRLEWEGFGEFEPSHVHKQVAIRFKAPCYKTIDITEPVKVFIHLRRPSDGAISEALPFQYVPLDAEPGSLKRKRLEYNQSNSIPGDLQAATYGEQTFVGCTSPDCLQNHTMKSTSNQLNTPFDNNQLLLPLETWNIPLSSQQEEYEQQWRLSPTPLIPTIINDLPSTAINLVDNNTSGLANNNQLLTPMEAWNMPSTSQQQPHQQWWFSPTSLAPPLTNGLNLPSSSMNLLDYSPSGLSSLLDLNSQELRQIEINSDELDAFDTIL